MKHFNPIVFLCHAGSLSKFIDSLSGNLRWFNSILIGHTNNYITTLDKPIN